MVKHTQNGQTIHSAVDDELFEFDHFNDLTLKGLMFVL